MQPANLFGKIIIAGGSGFLGLALAAHLAERGAEVVILSRSPPKAIGTWKHTPWDGRSLGDWVRELKERRGW